MKLKKESLAAMLLAALFVSTAYAGSVSYGTPQGNMGKYEQGKQENKENAEMASEEKQEEIEQEEDENTPSTYSKTVVIEKVPYYYDGRIIKQKELKKQVRGKRQKRGDVDGWFVSVKEEYVKYWHRTDRQKSPIIGVKTSEHFYPDEDGKPIDLESL